MIDKYTTATPDSYNYEDDKVCLNCSENIEDNKDFCSKFCYQEYHL